MMMTRCSYPQLLQFEDVAPLSLGCPACSDFGECRGRYVPKGGFFCTDACDSGTCRPGCVSPKHPERYHRALIEVGGFGFDDLDPIRCPEKLPDALSVMQHGSLLRHCRAAQSALKWAAIPLRGIIRFPTRGGKGRPPSWRGKYQDAASLRRAFSLAPGTKVVLICVDKDERIEPVWRNYNKGGFMEYFRHLEFAAVIPPNFSLYDHEPRAQHQYNRKRSLILAEEFSRFGIPVVPNFHAISPGDLIFWKDFLQSRPEITCIAEEFQTGLRHPRRGEAAIDELSRLQDQLGRPLHLAAIGGLRFSKRIKQRFSSSTMVSSQPFLLAASGLRMEERHFKSFGRVRDDADRGKTFLHNHRLLERLSKRSRRSKLEKIKRRHAHSLTGSQQVLPPAGSTTSTSIGGPAEPDTVQQETKVPRPT